MAPALRILAGLGLVTAATAAAPVHCGPESGDCGADDETSLLQMRSSSRSVAFGNATATPSPSNCASGVLMKFTKATVPKGVDLNWNFAQEKQSGSCEGSTGFGPSACCSGWGSNLTSEFSFKLDRQITPEWRLAGHLRLQVRGLFRFVDVGVFKIDCPVCGADCTIPDVVVAGSVFLPNRTIKMADCLDSAELDLKETFQLPDASPVPMQVRGIGTATVLNPDGDVASEMSITTDIMPR